MGRGTNRHAGLIVAVKLDLCEIWQIREVASPDASVQGRGGAIRIKSAKFDLLLVVLYPPPMGDWATDRVYDSADKMVNAAPSRCCVVVGGDLNAHVGCVRHPEREALDLEREVMAGCGEYHQMEANYNGERLAKFCRDQHMAMVNTYYPRGGPRTGEGGKSHPGWITFCFRPRDFSWSSIASSSEERADVFSSSPIDAHATIGH